MGASDSHNTAAGYSQSDYFGGHALSGCDARDSREREERGWAEYGPDQHGGLGGVWAEENTRESIFAAMQRKETFGTSGVRIKVRLFGGWDFRPDVLNQKDWVKSG